jgi:hypothetical protein
MRLILVICLAVLLRPGAARAEDTLQTDTSAFEHADAMSFYGFDGCGDALAGRLYRRALADKFAQCPFAPAARTRFAARLRAQQVKSSAILRGMIEANGGLPVRLDGMTRTCREQQDSAEYRQMRSVLDQYGRGEAPAAAVIGAPCDAASLTP